jgi:osmotically inducible protein OsmC
MNRNATAVWQGGLKDGKGFITTASKALSGMAYDFRMRFESEPGTNPEELIAAAHAGCFSMALSAELGKAGMTAQRIETRATVTLEMLEKGPTVTKVQLDLKAKIPGGDRAKFEKAAADAKAGCPISRLLNAEISLTTLLEG